jgi:ABC-type branched-subunit amino acid transport system substrate-binding protein
MRISRLRAGSLAVLVAAAMTLAGCSDSGSGSDGAYKIGMSMDLSGPISFNGKPAAAGLKAYIDALNKRGGVNGKTVDLKIVDDASDVAKGQVNVQQFIDEGRIAIFGFILTNLAISAVPMATESSVPVVGLGGPANLFEPVQPYYFSYELRAERLEAAILNYIAMVAKEQGIEQPRVAVFSVDTPANRDMVTKAVDDIASRGWVLAGEPQFMPVSPTDVTAQAQAIKEAEPDFVLMSHNDAGALVAVKSLRTQGVDVPVINQWAGSADATLEQLGEGYVAFRTFVSPTETDVPAVAEMRTAAQEHGAGDQMVNSYFTQGWVAGLIVEETLKACGVDCTGQGFRDALENLGQIVTDGLSGSLTVSAASHELVTTVRFYTWDAEAGRVTAVSDWVSAF